MMDLIYLSYVLLFGGVLAFELGAMDSDSDSDRPPADDGNGRPALYDADAYSAEVDGTEGADTLEAGTDTNLGFFAAGGDDSIAGSEAADFAEAGAGNDTLAMREGNDIVLGGDGDDVIDSGIGFDAVYGGTGADSIAGNGGNDTVLGEAGNDTVLGGSMADSVFGDAGDDFVGGLGLTESTPDGATVIDGADSLFGGLGNDTMFTGPGDVATAGAGNDLFRLDQSAGAFGQMSRITDWSDGDALELLYAPATDAGGQPVTPAVTLRAGTDGTSTIITLDGVDVATVAGARSLLATDIVLRAV